MKNKEFWQFKVPKLGVWKSVLLILVLSVVSIFISRELFSYIGEQQKSSYVDATTDALFADVESQYQILLDSARTIEQDQSLRNLIEQQDLLEISAKVNSYKENLGIKLMVTTDAEGVVLSRARFAGQRGDYIFDTSGYGAFPEEGNVIKMILSYSQQLPFMLNTGMGLYDENGERQGAIIIAEEFTDEYAVRVQNSLLRPSDHILFYEPQYGVIGSSFSDEHADLVKDRYASVAKTIGSDTTWLDTVSLEGVVYDVYHISFANLDDSYQQTTGGVIVFIEQKDALATVLLVSLLFIILTVGLVWFFAPMMRPKRIAGVGLVVLIGMGALYAAVPFAGTITTVPQSDELENQTFPIYNSTMMLNPASGILDTNFDQRVSVLIESGGEPINAALVELEFDPEKLRVEEIIDSPTFCEPGFVVERVIDNEAGVVSFACGTRTPFTGRTTTLVDIIVRPLVEGDSELLIADRTEVLAADGLGTNVLRTRTSGSYQIRESGAADELILFSRSHPNTTRWYNDQFASFSWRGSDYDSFAYVLSDEQLTEVPDNSLITSDRSLALQLEQDGVYYFHLQPMQDGQLVGNMYTHKINVDRTPPTQPVVKLSQTTVNPGELIRMEFGSTDETSGVESPYYYVSYNNSTFFPVQSPFYTALPDAGVDKIIIRAYDNAGNIAETVTPIEVTGTGNNTFGFRQAANVLNALSLYLTQ